MNTKFSLSIILTIGAFVLTAYLFVVCVFIYEDPSAMEYPGCGTTNSDFVMPVSAVATIDHPGAKIFDANCKSCHRLDRKIVGPALAGATDRYDSTWLMSWIRNSSKMIADGDPMAVALFNEYDRVQMTSFTSLTDQELRQLLEYIQFASEPKEIPLRPLP